MSEKLKNFLIHLVTVVIFLIAVFFVWKYFKGKEELENKTEKVLSLASEALAKTFDPIQMADVCSNREMTKVYEGLLPYHYLKRPFALVPELAESMPTVSDDQLVYTFKLRTDVKFHDDPCFPAGKGRALTAHDFVYSFKRLADPRNQAKGFWTVDGQIQGLNEWREKYANTAEVNYAADIAGVQAIDDYTLQFTLNKPYPQFLYVLALTPTFVVPHEAVKHYGADFGNHPVGTGPFITNNFNPQDTRIVYHKNPNFRDKRFPAEAAEEFKPMLAYAGKRLPFVDKIIVHIFPEEQPRWLKFKKAQLDIMDISNTNVALEIMQDNALSPSLKNKGVQLFKTGEISNQYFVINLSNRLFKNNVKLRQAMSMAFDKKQYNKLFYNNTAILAQSAIPPGLAGYRPDYTNPYGQFDLQKAKQYLADAGYPNGKGLPELTLDVGPTTADKQKGEFFQQCMKSLGIHVRVINNLFPELVKKINNKSTMFHSLGWSGDYPDADNFLQLFYAGGKKSDIGANLDDSAFNALYEKASVMADSPARTALYERMNEMLAAYVPAIFLVYISHLELQHGWIKNYNWSDFHYGTEQYWDIDLDQKKTLSAQWK